ncbi:hypothetical protein [Microbaculum marinum]|uniref:Secreted protein n=1 Tax=Microbaculum marinum TaxID=1764581 RepID=A0AAW9RWG2_9HYPH
MKLRTGSGRLVSIVILAATLLGGLSACESGPSMERLAPKMPKLRADVPETRHPESVNGVFPNINNAPDRPSVVRSEQELATIEDSLEKDGQSHVKQAVKRITGVETDEDVAEDAGETPGSSTDAAADQPTDIKPPD